MAGASALVVPNAKLNLIETYVGIEKPFRLFGATLKYGLYYVQGISSTGSLESQWKFGFDFFNPVTGKWTY